MAHVLRFCYFLLSKVNSKIYRLKTLLVYAESGCICLGQFVRIYFWLLKHDVHGILWMGWLKRIEWMSDCYLLNGSLFIQKMKIKSKLFNELSVLMQSLAVPDQLNFGYSGRAFCLCRTKTQIGFWLVSNIHCTV